MSASRPAVDSLKNELCQAIDTYLTTDNPAPDANAGFFAKAAAAAVSIYSRKGESGRTRARAYKASIETSTESQNALLVRVTNDIKRGDSCLSTSSKLRDRLLEGLCAYHGITKDQIDHAVDKARHAAISAMAYAGAQAYAALPSEADIRRSAIFTLLSSAIVAAKAEVHLEQSREDVINSAKDSRDNRSLIGDMSL